MIQHVLVLFTVSNLKTKPTKMPNGSSFILIPHLTIRGGISIWANYISILICSNSYGRSNQLFEVLRNIRWKVEETDSARTLYRTPPPAWYRSAEPSQDASIGTLARHAYSITSSRPGNVDCVILFELEFDIMTSTS